MKNKHVENKIIYPHLDKDISNYVNIVKTSMKEEPINSCFYFNIGKTHERSVDHDNYLLKKITSLGYPCFIHYKLDSDELIIRNISRDG